MIMTNHIVQSFDADLDQIESLVTQMGGVVETQIADVVVALVSRDAELGDRVRKGDRHVDELETAFDSAVVRVLALRQPQAQDLRAVVAVLKISTNLE